MGGNGMRENHILIIDDDLMLLKTAEEILSDQYNVSVAKSGIQALNLLNKNIIPDLILLDIDMPQMDGYETLEEIKKELLPLVTLITPNIDEAKVLTGKSIHNIQDMQTAAKMLTDDYQTNILLKGGHLEGDNMCDLLHTSEFIYHIYEEKKIESHNLHGTGCTLSSAIATYLAKGYPMRESIQHAKTYITQAIIAGKELNIGHGNGPLWHFPDTVAQMCTFCAVVS